MRDREAGGPQRASLDAANQSVLARSGTVNHSIETLGFLAALSHRGDPFRQRG